MTDLQARIIAFYLPQYHPIPENDEWWGKGFTEWTNVTKAKPLFKGHHQPNLPADLGYYDLRLPEARIAQAELAKQFGISGFCYWHYWFGDGRRILERPFDEVLESKFPDFPFCLAWANESWTGIWHGAANRSLIDQKYPGPSDHEKHFYQVLPAFEDPRYIRLNDHPVFVLYRPYNIPDTRKFIEQWQELALKEGFLGIHFIGVHYNYNNKPEGIGLNAFIFSNENYLRNQVNTRMGKLNRWLSRRPEHVYEYAEAIKHFYPKVKLDYLFYPCVIPNWDNTPRSGMKGTVLNHSTPELFGRALEQAIDVIKGHPIENRLIFIKSWNEWAEGNYLEPDQRWGRSYLEIMKKVIENKTLA